MDPQRPRLAASVGDDSGTRTHARPRRSGRRARSSGTGARRCGALDEPSVNPIDAIRYDEWEREEWQHPDLAFDGSTMVLKGDTMVAFTWLRVDAERGRGVSAFTATRPEFRGRGLATRAKLRTLRWAAENGINSMTTTNDDSNVGILTVNRRLGFEPIGTLLTYQRHV